MRARACLWGTDPNGPASPRPTSPPRHTATLLACWGPSSLCPGAWEPVQQLQRLMGPGLSCSHPLAAGQGCSQGRGPLLGAGIGGYSQAGGSVRGGKLTPRERSSPPPHRGPRLPQGRGALPQDCHARGPCQSHFFGKPWTLREDKSQLLRHVCLTSSNPAYPLLGSSCHITALSPSSFLPSGSDGLAEETSLHPSTTSPQPRKETAKRILSLSLP